MKKKYLIFILLLIISPAFAFEKNFTLITMFEVLQPDGTINEELLGKFPQDVQDKVRASLQNITTFTTDSFKSKLISAKFSSADVPEMWYTEGKWDKSSDSKYLGTTTKDKYSYGGNETSSAGSNTIHKVKYHMYDGKNPFYSPIGSFNTATYGDKTDTIMNRFMFYRFVGKAVRLISLDNVLVAVDTYTGLVFSFGKPTKFVGTFPGFPDNPAEWGTVGKFYENDPAGYIDKDGKFILEDWYIKSQTAGKYTPSKTGKSPYLHKVIIGSGGSVVVPEDPTSFTPVIIATTLEKDGILEETAGENLGKYYIGITFPEKEFDVKYELFIREGGSGAWSNKAVIVDIPAKTADATYRHYDALILTDLPQYKVIAKNLISEEVLGESGAVIGSRMLTEREILLASIETIRVAFDQLWYTTGVGIKNRLKKGSANGTSGTYYHGITWTMSGFKFIPNWNAFSRYQLFDSYNKNTLITVNGTFMQNKSGGTPTGDTSVHGIYSHNSSGWINNANFKPRTDKLSVSFGGVPIDIVLNNIKIDNDDKNDPQWTSGSFKIGENEYDKDSGVPFGFFMDAATFRSQIVGAGYTQK